MGSEHGSALAAVGFHGQSLSSPPGSKLRASVSPPPCKVGVTHSGADRVRRVTDVTGAGQAGTVTDCTASSPSQGAAALGSSVLSHSIDSVVFEGMSVSWLGVLASGEPRGANRGI